MSMTFVSPDLSPILVREGKHPVAVVVELRVVSAAWGEFCRRVDIEPTHRAWERKAAWYQAQGLVKQLERWLWPNEERLPPEVARLRDVEKRLVGALETVREARVCEERKEYAERMGLKK